MQFLQTIISWSGKRMGTGRQEAGPHWTQAQMAESGIFSQWLPRQDAELLFVRATVCTTHSGFSDKPLLHSTHQAQDDEGEFRQVTESPYSTEWPQTSFTQWL